MENFRVEFRRKPEGPHSETKIRFDIERQQITLEGSDETALRTLLVSIFANGGVTVRSDQELHLELEEAPCDATKQYFEFVFRSGVLIREKATTLSLKVTARDGAGNMASAAAVPTFGRRP